MKHGIEGKKIKHRIPVSRKPTMIIRPGKGKGSYSRKTVRRHELEESLGEF